MMSEEKEYYTKEELLELLAMQRKMLLEKAQKERPRPVGLPEKYETFAQWKKDNPRQYLEAMGWKRELTFIDVSHNPMNHKITVAEYDFYADEYPCPASKCQSSKWTYIKIERGTLVSHCYNCKQTGLFGLEHRKRPARNERTVTLEQAIEIMRDNWGLNQEQIERIPWIQEIRDAREQAKIRQRPRPKKES